MQSLSIKRIVKRDPIITYAKLINELSIILKTFLDTDEVSWLRETLRLQSIGKCKSNKSFRNS